MRDHVLSRGQNDSLLGSNNNNKNVDRRKVKVRRERGKVREGEAVLLRHSYFVLSGTCIEITDKIEQEKKGLSNGNDFQGSILGDSLGSALCSAWHPIVSNCYQHLKI